MMALYVITHARTQARTHARTHRRARARPTQSKRNFNSNRTNIHYMHYSDMFVLYVQKISLDFNNSGTLLE